MEGDLGLAAGAVIRVGYDLTIPGTHADTDVTFATPTVSFDWTCASGPGSGTFVVTMPDMTVRYPAYSFAWYPSGDAKANADYQGSYTIPATLCPAGSLLRLHGGTFTTDIGILGADKVHVRWHYSAFDGSAWTTGGWSATGTATS
jgi:hypothetical protein